MDDRLTEVLGFVVKSNSFTKSEKELINGIIELSDELSAMDYSDYQDTIADDDSYVELIANTLNRDVSDTI